MHLCYITGAADGRAAGLPDVLHPGDPHQQGQGGQGGQEASLGLPHCTGEGGGREEGGQGGGRAGRRGSQGGGRAGMGEPREEGKLFSSPSLISLVQRC